MANPVNTFAKFMLDTMSKSAQTTYADILNTRAREDAQAHDLERQQKAYENDISKLRENYDLQGKQWTERQEKRAKAAAEFFGVESLGELYNKVRNNPEQGAGILNLIYGSEHLDPKWYVREKEPPPEPSYLHLGNVSYTSNSGPNSGTQSNWEVAIAEGYGLSDELIAEMKGDIGELKVQPTPAMLRGLVKEKYKVDIPDDAFQITKLEPKSWRTAKPEGGYDKKVENSLRHGYNAVAERAEDLANAKNAPTSFFNLMSAIESNNASIIDIVGDDANRNDITTFRSSFRVQGKINPSVLEEKINHAHNKVEEYEGFMEDYNTRGDAVKVGLAGRKKEHEASAANATLAALGEIQGILEDMERVAEDNLSPKSPITLLIDDIREGIINIKGTTIPVKKDAENWLNIRGYYDVVKHFEEQLYTILGTGE